MLDILGFKRTTWHSYENGVSQPGFDDLVKISNYFNVTIDDLLTKDLFKDGNLNFNEEESNNQLKGNLNSNPKGNLMPIKQGISGPITFQLNEPKDAEEATMWYLFQQVHRLEKEITKLKDKINNSGHSSQ